jgi:hypothetical protein
MCFKLLGHHLVALGGWFEGRGLPTSRVSPPTSSLLTEIHREPQQRAVVVRGEAGVVAGEAVRGHQPAQDADVALRPNAPSRVTATHELRIVTLGIRVGDRSRGCFATPADFPRHERSPYSHARR